MELGFCECGCGQRTTIAPQTVTKLGYVKGKPRRFVMRHQQLMKGKSQADWLIEAVRAWNFDECLLWPFKSNNKGYGMVEFEGHTRLAHRVAFKIFNGRFPMPNGLHDCDTPLCFNPRHISEGTQKDNQQDASRKLRLPHKLNPEMVTAIRREYVPCKRGMLALLGRKYNVHYSTIVNIVSGKHWKFLEDTCQ